MTDVHPTDANKHASIPPWLCWLTNVIAQTSVVFFSGIIFGWAPLELILIREGQYSELCSGSSSTVAGASDMTCPVQTNQLHGLFTMAQFWLSFASLPVGYVLDNLPKSVVLSVCAVIEITGLLLFAVSESNPDHDTQSVGTDVNVEHASLLSAVVDRDHFMLAYSMLAVGGSMTMLSAFPATFLLPTAQALLLASISCLFDASSAIFYFFDVLQEDYGIDRRTLFIGYAIWAAFLYLVLVICWVVLERRNWKDYVTSLTSSTHSEVDSDSHSDDDVEEKGNGDVVNGNPQTERHVEDPHITWTRRRGVQNLTIWQQLCTYDFGLALIFTMVHALRCNFFIMTVDDYLMYIGDVTTSYAKLFSWILPCGLVFVPWIERTVSILGLHAMMHVANALGVLFGVLLWIPSLNLQVFNFFLFTAFRAYLYATLNTFLAMTFGVHTMGRVLGFAFTIAAVFSLIQYPLAVWTQTYADGDYIYANIFLVILCAPPILSGWYYTKMARSDMSNNEHEYEPLSGDIKTEGYGSLQYNKKGSDRLQMASPSLLLASPGSPMLQSVRRSADHQRRHKRRQAEQI